MTSFPMRLRGAIEASLMELLHPSSAFRAESGMSTGRPLSPIHTAVTRARTAGSASGPSIARQISWAIVSDVLRNRSVRVRILRSCPWRQSFR